MSLHTSSSSSDAGHRLEYSPRHATTLSSPNEAWDDDDDFDLSSMSGNTLELPRSEIDSDNGKEEERVTVLLGGDKEGDNWDAEFAEDEDQVDTIKLSTLTEATLAQLASLTSSPSVETPAASSTPAPAVTVPPPPSRSRRRRPRRKKPMLISNLGGPNTAPRVIGEMKWNPALQRWEGNEVEGLKFENAIRGSGRPSLITKASIGNLATTQVRSNLVSPPPMGTKVVGDMIFDPIRLCWLNKNKEDEVDPFASINDESDEDIQQTSTRNERTSSAKDSDAEYSIKVHPSSSSLRQSSDTQAADAQWSISAIRKVLRGRNRRRVPNNLVDVVPAALWVECQAATARHDEEMMGFLPSKLDSQQVPSKRINNAARDRNSHLYLIQALARKAISK